MYVYGKRRGEGLYRYIFPCFAGILHSLSLPQNISVPSRYLVLAHYSYIYSKIHYNSGVRKQILQGSNFNGAWFN